MKFSHTIVLPISSLLLADCDDTCCGATSRLLALFSGSFCCCFTTIFTVVLTYVISTGATPVSPPPQPVCDRLRTLGLWTPCLPVWSRDGDPGLRFVRRRGYRAGRVAADRNVNKSYQLIGRGRMPSSPAPSDHVSSSAVLGCLNVRSLLRINDDVIEL